MADEGEGQSGEVASPAHAADDHVGEIAGEFHLFFRLQADDRLVEHDVIQHAAQRIFCSRVGDCRFDGLANGHAQAARAIGIGSQELPSGVGLYRRAGSNLAAPKLHHRAAIWFLIVTHLDHENFAFHVEQGAGKG